SILHCYYHLRSVCCRFFFQAEDGIRDRNVTGVQTCALPISNTSIANALVPADILPFFFSTLLVATIPVPASPSGGQSGTPGSKLFVGSNNLAPCSVKQPAFVPAVRTFGKTDSISHSNCLSLISSSN